MSSKRIVIVGGCALAFGAAFANTGLVLTTGTSVSHLTGDIAKLTISITQWDPAILPEIYRVSSAALSFLLGATLAGALIHHPVLDISRPYGRTITGIGLLFITASLFLTKSPTLGVALAGFACGIQNALASHFRGIVLRTTHLTGMFTDLGTALGMKLRGYTLPGWKITIPALLILSFFAGGMAGALAYFSGKNPVYVAGLTYMIGGILWSIKKRTSFWLTKNPPDSTT